MKPVLLASHTEDAPMMKIDCPFCGPRDELEFKCGGQSHVQRPDLSASDGEWAEYLSVRENPKGWHFERWLHAAGCRQWFNIARHNVTPELATVYPITETGKDAGRE